MALKISGGISGSPVGVMAESPAEEVPLSLRDSPVSGAESTLDLFALFLVVFLLCRFFFVTNGFVLGVWSI